MTKLTPSYPIVLTFDQHPITVLTDEAGAPWWIADEICDALTIAMPHRALAGLDDDEKGRHTVTTPGGPQRKATINESGLYSLILRSRKPEAKRFKKWVTSEVLPQIRKTGSYGSTLTTREADLSALTDAVSAIVPALTAITTTLAALGARVAALEASRPAPHPTRTGPDFYALLKAHFEPDTGTWMTNEEVRAVLRPGAWNKSEVIALNKALVQLGAPERRRHGNIRVFGVRRIALPAPRRESGPFDRPALPAPRSEPPAEWNGVPVEEILNDNLHLAGVGCWLYGAVADPDVTPKGAQPDPSRVFRPGVLVSGTRIHPGPGAYAWTSFDWLHVHISADIWTAHRAGDPRATWLIGKIVDRYQTHIEALREVERERRSLPRLANGRYAQAGDKVKERLAAWGW